MLFHPRTVTVDGIETIYRVFVPDVAPPWPVILFLHGAGESGSDGLAQTTVGIGPAIVREPERFPAIVVFPQASRGYGWREFNLDAAVAALDDVEASFDVDRDRTAITGISMGGYGTWLLASQQPERFSCAVPICGGLDRVAGTPESAVAKLKDLPQWVFHGDADNVIPVTESRIMVAALKAAGAKDVRYTEYPGVKHNSWDRAYAERELVGWMVGKKLTADR